MVKVVAVIPALGRFPLLKHTIDRLYNRNGIHEVIVVGGMQEREFCKGTRVKFIYHSNVPLAAKWNAGFRAAQVMQPDFCLFVGSSDWVSDNWIPEMIPHAQQYDLVGTPGCYFLHVAMPVPRLCHWPGYVNKREGESIGIGRLISAKILDKLRWQPFNPELHTSLDNSMQQRIIAAAGSTHLVRNPSIKSVSISTDVWPNKHRFNDHYTGRLPSKIITNPGRWIDENFPEAKLIF